MKYIFVTGGVVSGLGKGVVAASIGRLLKEQGYRVISQKLDPYINVDPGTMSPFQHGEVFVTDDGAETDLDLGHYERFIDEKLNKYSNLTSGKVYWNVLNKEREGVYLGETVQVVPHITDEIKEFIYNVGKHSDADIVITEIGGTVGDMESQPFLEAVRQVGNEVGRENCIYVHLVLIPQIPGTNEYKTKPAQHSVKTLQGLGISPNILVTRLDGYLDESSKKKLALFCNMSLESIVESSTVNNLYEAPIMLYNNGITKTINKVLKLEKTVCNLSHWGDMVNKMNSAEKEITIGLVGKYVQLHDAYLSVSESLRHAGYENNAKINIKWLDSELITDYTVSDLLQGVDGVLVAGGFGNRGIEGKICACKYARENKIPYFGICLGMQIAVIEYARNVVGLKGANSKEFDENVHDAVIDLMPDQYGNLPMGGTLRLGAYPCNIKPNTLLFDLYRTENISERHRHRYEFNNAFRALFKEKGMVFGGTSPDGRLVESVELSDHPFFIGVQYHPEFKSRPNKPHPVFKGFIEASVKCKENR